MDTIEIFELKNIHGCAWRDENGRVHYGFSRLPEAAQLWLQCADGHAVTLILDAVLGSVVRIEPGAYGGEVRTVSVDVETLETHCRAYWDGRKAQVVDACHYCGLPTDATGFFDEPVCSECS